MAEQVQRFRQYEYRANSNLVLTTDQHRPRNDEPSGEPESLKERLGSTRFGDRVHFSKPDIEEAGKKRRPSEVGLSVKRAKKENATVLGLAEDIDSYHPRSKETRCAYEDLLSFIAQQLGDQPHDILRGAADEVIACLKNAALSDPERKRDVESLLNALSSEGFATLVEVMLAHTNPLASRSPHTASSHAASPQIAWPRLLSRKCSARRDVPNIPLLHIAPGG